MNGQRPLIQFISLHSFDRMAEGILDDEDIRLIQQTLMDRPRAGTVVPGSGGMRKVRVPLAARGKRGGARAVYLYLEVRSVIYLVAVFARNEKEDISGAGYNVLARLAKQLREEG